MIIISPRQRAKGCRWGGHSPAPSKSELPSDTYSHKLYILCKCIYTSVLVIKDTSFLEQLFEHGKNSIVLRHSIWPSRTEIAHHWSIHTFVCRLCTYVFLHIKKKEKKKNEHKPTFERRRAAVVSEALHINQQTYVVPPCQEKQSN